MKISVVVISYNMEAQLKNTLTSLSMPYQKGILVNPEIIVVDNGSDQLPDLSDYPHVRLIKHHNPTVSPVAAVNEGLRTCTGDLIGLLIDGARLITPGLIAEVTKASKLGDYSIITTLGFHLGHEPQQQSVLKGYDNEQEQALLNSINWPHCNGYELYNISSLAGSSKQGLFKPMAECNAIFMLKNFWNKLDGVNEHFKSLGGGIANHDLLSRACETPNAELITLLSEGSFHQYHGGITTNQKREDASWKVFVEEYELIYGKGYKLPTKIPTIFGEPRQEVAKLIQHSLQQLNLQ